MTVLSASNTLSPTPRFRELAKSAPQIQNVSSVTTSAWLPSAIAQVGEIEGTGELVVGFGDFRVKAEAANRARQMLSSIEANFIPAPLVAPISGGGLSISWSVGGKEVKLAFEPDGSAYCFSFENDEMLEGAEDTLQTSSQVVNRLVWMVGRRS